MTQLSPSKLTSLETIPGFTLPIREYLSEYWITSAEEFISTAKLRNNQFGTGLAAMRSVLQIDDRRMAELFEAADAAIPGPRAFDVLPIYEIVTGAILDNLPLAPPATFDVPFDLPHAHKLATTLPPPGNQGRRPTCVAFATVVLYQCLRPTEEDLSEQFLFWCCKEHDNLPGYLAERGTSPVTAMDVMRQFGVCSESLWLYNPLSIAGNVGQSPPPDRAKVFADASTRRITGVSYLDCTNIHTIKKTLVDGRAVMIGIGVYEHWANAWQVRALGRVRKPLPGEDYQGGHAMAVVGYQDDQTVPGGGYFIVRNSWGTGWATDNPDSAGYAHIPYQQMFDYNRLAVVMDACV